LLIYRQSGTARIGRPRNPRGQSRRGQPFVPINCGAIPESLLESQLFGHVRGAFTAPCRRSAACSRRRTAARFFLDEIGELPVHVQVKLLRVIRRSKFGGRQRQARVGSIPDRREHPIGISPRKSEAGDSATIFFIALR